MNSFLFAGGLFACALVVSVFPGTASGAQEATFYTQPVLIEHDGFRGLLAQIAPNVYMSGQPNPKGLDALADFGVTTVINLRTQPEMDNREVVDFDEAAYLDDQDINYVHIPSGGPETPYSPAMVGQFAQALDTALDKTQGSVLLHCTVAWRASHLWAAYLVRYEGLSITEAVDIARQLNFGDVPLEGFLGEKIVLQTVEDN